ncbi:Permease of the drug/metabolite transporter (DMT) superfamily [Lachnospiraceae bacterium TWA4]|nr:Permease of the drug/metabolite transporter (DMT) superfamily [Lachnospiraceae bacterium TWA4]
MKHLKGNLCLTLTAFIWGLAFVAQSVGMDYVGPFTFNFLRFFVGGISLIPVMFLLRKGNFTESASKNENSIESTSHKASKNLLVISGICCGVILGIASNFQQIGIQYTTIGKAGFITALYIIIVPIIGIFLKKSIGLKVWISVAIALVGMYLLCITESLSLGTGDLFVLLCAFIFSLHIICVDYFSPKVDSVKLSCIQFFVASLVSCIGMLILESPSINGVLLAWMPILYAGIFSSGVGYTLQVIGQKYTSPTEASLIMSLESVFSLLAGWVILHERLSTKELLGCALVFIAIILTQLPDKKTKS